MPPKIKIMPYKNKEDRKKYNQAYSQTHKAEIAEQRSRFYQLNKDRINEAKRKYLANNPEVRKRQSENNKRYREQNRDKVREMNHRWVETHKYQTKEYHHAYNQQWYLKHKEEHDDKGRIWGSKAENKAKRVKYVQKYVKNNIVKVKEYQKGFEQTVEGKYRQLIFRAKHFSGTPITKERFAELFIKPCIYCGFIGKIGIDRVDNAQGYTFENSAPCCKTCNFMKKTMLKENFLSHIKKIYLYSGK